MLSITVINSALLKALGCVPFGVCVCVCLREGTENQITCFQSDSVLAESLQHNTSGREDSFNSFCAVLLHMHFPEAIFVPCLCPLC